MNPPTLSATQAAQLPLWKRTTAQIVYGVWLDNMRSLSPARFHPATCTEMTAKELNIDESLVARIVKTQSRWDARRLLRKAGVR